MKEVDEYFDQPVDFKKEGDEYLHQTVDFKKVSRSVTTFIGLLILFISLVFP